MSFKYQYQPLPLANEEQFEDFIKDLFNELYTPKRYEKYGTRGQNQDGIDIICYSENTVIQCKKKERASARMTDKRIKEKLIQEFEDDVISAVNSSDFEFEKFIFVTTYPNDTTLQNLSNKLSEKYGKDIEYCGWGVISNKIEDCPNTLGKYYSFLNPESSRISDTNFKETVKDKHIIDQCYESLIRFNGLNFVDPNTIANVFPFKVESERTYPLYNRFCLSTNNKNLTDLFDLLEIKNKKFEIKDAVRNDLEKQCLNVDEKISLIQETLRNYLIYCIKTTDGIHHKVPKSNHINCSCNACLVEELKFYDLSINLENEPSSLLKVYGYYQLNDFQKAKEVLKDYLKHEFHPINLVIAIYNEYWLSILNSNERVSKYDFYSKIRSIEFDNEPIQETIIDLEQDRILSKSYQKVDSITSEIKRIYYGYEKGILTVNSGPDYVDQLTLETMIVYFHYRRNFLIKDIYGEYKSFFRKALSGWLFSINTNEKYANKLNKLEVFHIAMSVFSSSGKELLSILEETNTDCLKLSNEACKFLEKICSNFLNSFKKESNYTTYLKKDSFGLGGRHRNLFQSILINLSYSSISTCPKDLFSNLFEFIKKENFLFPYDYYYLGILFRMKGEWFNMEEHLLILRFHLDSKKLNSDFVCDLMDSYIKNKYAKVEDSELLFKILNSNFNNYEAAEVIRYLRLVSEESNLEKLDNKLIERLKEKFDSDLYRVLLIDDADFVTNDEELFEKYVLEINKTKGSSIWINHQGFEISGSYVFINFISAILMSGHRELNDPIILKNLNELSNYQMWLFNPETFDYSNFNIDWIGFTNIPIVLKHVGKSKDLRRIVFQELEKGNSKNLQENFIKILTSNGFE